VTPHFFYIFDITKSSSYTGDSVSKKINWKIFARKSLSQTVLSKFSLLVTTFSTRVCSFFPVFAVMELSDRQLEAKDDVSDFPCYLGRVRLGSIRNKNNWNNARKRLFGSYSHSGIPGFPFRLFCSQEQNSRKSKNNDVIVSHASKDGLVVRASPEAAE